MWRCEQNKRVTYLAAGTLVRHKKLLRTLRRLARTCAKGVTIKSSPWLWTKINLINIKSRDKPVRALPNKSWGKSIITGARGGWQKDFILRRNLIPWRIKASKLIMILDNTSLSNLRYLKDKNGAQCLNIVLHKLGNEGWKIKVYKLVHYKILNI